MLRLLTGRNILAVLFSLKSSKETCPLRSLAEWKEEKTVKTLTCYFNKCVLSSYYVSGTVLDFVAITVNRVDAETAFLGLIFELRMTENNNRN